MITLKLFMAQLRLDRTENMQIKALDGYVALTTVIILSIVATMVVMSLIVINTESSVVAGEMVDSRQANALADTCAEIAISNLKDSVGYAGGETITIGVETCDILPVQGGGNQARIVQTEATVGDQTRRVQVEITEVNPDIVVGGWEEVGEF